MKENKTKKINGNHIARNIIRAYNRYYGKPKLTDELKQELIQAYKIPGVETFINLLNGGKKCENFRVFLKEHQYKVVFDKNSRIKMSIIDSDYVQFIEKAQRKAQKKAKQKI